MPPTLKAPPPPPTSTAARKVTFGKIASASGHRTLLYGPGGVGKTTLATLAPGPVAFFDLDDSLSRLQSQLTTLPLIAGSPADDWQAIRLALQADGWGDVKTIVIDSVTRLEELCVAFTCATVPHEKGHRVTKIEDYGYGKGYQFVFDTFLPILGDLDRHCRAGRNVILIAHDCTTNVPNPAGEDWLRWEPRLQNPASGKASIRLRVKEWSDHTLFLGYDVAVDKEGKGRGSGTRTLWPAELPHCLAKSRSCQVPFPVDDGSQVWAQIIK